MSRRAEYFWLTLLLPVTIFVLLFLNRQDARQESAPRKGVVTPISSQQITRDPRPVVLAPTLPPVENREVASIGSIAEIDRAGARGLNELGMRYINGTGVGRDVDAAFLFFSVAADQGDVSAIDNLGKMYEEGWGTEPDRKKALQLYARAAQLGSQLARENVQRLAAATSERTPTESPRRSATTGVAIEPKKAIERDDSGQDQMVPITGPARSEVRADAFGLLSPEVAGPPGAIGSAESNAAGVPRVKRSPDADTLRRRSKTPAAPNPPAVRKSLRPDAAANFRQTKAVTKPEPRTEISARPRRSGVSTRTLSSLTDPGHRGLLETCVTGNWAGAKSCFSPQ